MKRISRAEKKTVRLLPTVPVIACMLLTGCDSAEQKAQNAEWEAQASENAKAYIMQKYGFSAEVREAKVDRMRGMFGTTPISDVFVDMRYDKRDFTVYITGQKESTEGSDSYQAEEIEQALSETIEREVPGLKLLDIYPQDKTEQDQETFFYSAYFDGTNLPGVLADGAGSFEAFYVDTDLSDEKMFEWLGDYSTKASFVNCREGSILEADRLTRSWAAPQPVYCDSIRNIDAQVKQQDYKVYELKDQGDFFYYVNNNYRPEKGEPSADMPVITRVEQQEPSVFNGWGAMNASVISKTFTISSEAPVYVHVYYPISSLFTERDIDTYRDDFRYGRITEENGSIKYHADQVKVVGDYVYANFYVCEDVPVTFEFLLDP